MTNTPTTPPDDELREELNRHWIKRNINLGQYKSEFWCDCGAKLIMDGHADDWRSSYRSVVNNHLAQVAKQALAAHLSAEVAKARTEMMVTVLLSVGGTLEITRKAIEEAGPEHTVFVQPTSRLDGGLVYTLQAAQPKPTGEVER